MDAIKLLEERRSVRSYKKEKVDRELMKEIVSISRWAPSWANTQVARYTIVDSDEKIKEICQDGLDGFVYNINTLKNANGVAILSFVKGKSGRLGDNDYASAKEKSWEIFDAGIACQTFCLAAHEKGVGTCIMGVINEKNIAKIVNLPEEETVAAIIVYGYPDGETKPTPRKKVEEILRFVD